MQPLSPRMQVILFRLAWALRLGAILLMAVAILLIWRTGQRVGLPGILGSIALGFIALAFLVSVYGWLRTPRRS